MIDEKADSRISGSKIFKWFAVLLYAALIFFISSLSQPNLPDLPKIFMLDKVFHFTEYALLGFLLYRALSGRFPSKKTILAAFGIAATYGLTDEIHQHFVAMRKTEFMDFVADSMGGGTGAFMGFLIQKKRYK